MNDITLPLIIASAAADSINPCAFAVLIFLIMYLITMKSKKRMLIMGSVYITVVYLVYFLAGLGLLGALQSIHITKFFYYFTAGLSVVLGLINVKDYWWYGRGISLAIPDSKKTLLQKYIAKATLPATIILGVLVAIFELPCTGGVYLAIIALLADQKSWGSGVAYLAFYNIIFILPLAFLVFAAYYGVSPKALEAWRQGQKKILRLIIGIVLIALGALMFLIAG